jgi:two-component system, NtrC family, response regulator AtoC
MAHLLLPHCRGLAQLNGASTPVAETPPGDLWASLMIPGISASITLLQRVIVEIAPTGIPILILGESGTGKEVIASEIHRLSPRCKEPFVKFNCSSMGFDWLLRTGLQNPGNNEHARHDGTVLFDEVTQLDLVKQTDLLNLLPDGERAVSPTCLTSRIISTSTKDLADEMRGGTFSEKLYYRLNGICLRIPSLRQRKEDIPHLVAAFLARYANLLGRQQPQIKNSTLDLLMQHSWPGNVRELENIVRKIVVLGDDDLVMSDLATNTDLRAASKPFPNGTHVNPGSLKQASREASRKAERQLILESLERTHWNRKRSARELQISYKAMLYKLKQLGLDDSRTAGSD